jgi:phosphatidylserine/phosphatidylglycerophosphate/cardiolipin synthase-like enzyme
MTAEAAARITRMEMLNPHSVNLARLLSLAVMLEPALIRATRIELLRRADVSAEADLWFGPLVQTRSRDAIVLVPEVAETLRGDLNSSLAQRSWNIIMRVHGYLPPLIQLEEQLNYLSIDPEQNRAAINKALQSPLATLIEHGRREIANWAGRALPRLPQVVRSTEGAAMLAVASDLRLGRTFKIAQHLRDGKIPDWFAKMLPESFPKADLGIIASAEGLTFDPTPPTGVAFIQVPATEPRVVQISAGGQTRIIFVEAKTPQFVPLAFDGTPIELVTIAGQAFRMDIESSGPSFDRPLSCRSYANCNQALVAWHASAPIEKCLGFAVERIDVDGKAEILRHNVGTERGSMTREPLLSTIAPIQRFTWIDRAPSGTRCSYRITPVVGAPNGTQLIPDLAVTTNSVEVAVDWQGPITAIFNRQPDVSQLRASPKNATRATREELGGEMRRALMSVLKNATADQESSVYVALWYIEDDELLETLAALKNRAHVILSGDKLMARNPIRAATARRALVSSELHFRTRPPRFSHVSFMVVFRRGEPSSVWTGSVPWSSRALYGQDSNALIIQDKAVAACYFDRWQLLRHDPPAVELRATTTGPAEFVLSDGTRTRLWFAPANKGGDLDEVRAWFSRARTAILFAAGPRSQKSLFNEAVRLSDRLYVAGIASTSDSGSRVALYRDGSETLVTPQRLPRGIVEATGTKLDTEALPVGSRIVAIDPFGDNPVVIAGSHLFSPGASALNDEDMLIIQGNRGLAEQTAVHIKGLIDHYTFEAAMGAAKTRGPPLPSEDSWQKPFQDPKRQRETLFWMGMLGHTRIETPAVGADDQASEGADTRVIKKEPPRKKAKARATRPKPSKKARSRASPTGKGARESASAVSKNAGKRAKPKTSGSSARPTKKRKKPARSSTVSRKSSRRRRLSKKK